MKTFNFIKIWIIIFILLLLSDFILHAFLLKNIFEKELNGIVLSADKAKILPILLVELIISYCITYFESILDYKTKETKKILILGTILGFMVTGVYHLVNISTLPKWSIEVSIVDTIVAGVLQYCILIYLTTYLYQKFK